MTAPIQPFLSPTGSPVPSDRDPTLFQSQTLPCAMGLEVTADSVQKEMPPPTWQAWACSAEGHRGPGKVQKVKLGSFPLPS